MSRLAGHRPTETVVTVDYADVLRQAVENERWRVVRDIRARVEKIRVKGRYESGSHDEEAVKRQALRALDDAQEALS